MTTILAPTIFAILSTDAVTFQKHAQPTSRARLPSVMPPVVNAEFALFLAIQNSQLSPSELVSERLLSSELSSPQLPPPPLVLVEALTQLLKRASLLVWLDP